MFFNDWSMHLFESWQSKAEAAVGVSGHGSRKAIAEALGLTSETIKNAEKKGLASQKMISALQRFLEDEEFTPYPEIDGGEGRWNVGPARNGVYVTHVVRPFAFTAFFSGVDCSDVKLVTYDNIDSETLRSMMGEAEDLAVEYLGRDG